MRDYGLGGRRVVLTGAAGVIGTWLAEAFARAGADLLLTDARPLDRLAGRLGARAVTADLAAGAGVRTLLSAMDDAWPSPDVVVNNAGLYPRTPVGGTGRELVERVLAVNVVAAFQICQHAIARMTEAGVRGCLVTIGSGAAVRPRAGGSVYAASKAAVETMTRALALEVADRGIRVNAVAPGFAPGSEVSELPPDHVRRMLGSIPLGRASGPGDAPAAVLWLCSDDASFVTGTTVTVDGGRTAGDFTGGRER
jgi:3-oxoacyl-[acyl-carrier protein] reductase